MKNKMSAGLLFSIVMLIVSVGVMFVLLNMSSSLRGAKPNNMKTTSLSDIKVDELPPQEGQEDKLNVKNFSASLADILYGKELSGNYKVETSYQGAKFNFNCTKMDGEACVSGSALMNVGTAILPLYSFDKEEDNYYNHQGDYYIIVNDNNIILTNNYAGKSAGKIKIYDRQGNKLSEINNVITGYISNNILEDQLYPSLNNHELKYYTCMNNQVFKTGVNIDNPGVVLLNEKVKGIKCY